MHKAYEKMLRQEYGDLVFEHQMILASAFKESVAKRTPVSISAPKSAAAESMRLIVDELLARTSAIKLNIRNVLWETRPTP